MDAGSFLSALLAIVVIDIVLAGDNAIVIALAARQLPPHLRRRAIVWGALGAVVVRVVLTAAVVWLLKIPGLLAVGGAALLWIAWRLLQPEEAANHQPNAPAATGFWGAMRTVIVADALMGLDNVLAVAGAAHGSIVLVVLGLLISVPIVMWGSTLVLKVVERVPAVVYLGAGVLVWTAVTMMLGEPLLQAWLAEQGLNGRTLYALVPLLLVAAFWHNHRRLDSRIHARLLELRSLHPRRASSTTATGDRAMLNVLVPIDGSKNSLNALRHAIDEYRRDHELKLHLLHVQPRLSRHIARFVSRGERTAWHHERADAALAGARELLRSAAVPYEEQWCMGDRADEICRAAQQLQCHHIVMGTARKNSLTRMLEDSVTHNVLENASVPVEVVVGRSVSRLERWAVPTGLGLGLGGLLWAVLAE